MADILIKNMTLPVDNAILHLKINADGDVVEIFDGRSLFNGVKAIELPEHGDLVNLSDVYEALNREIVPKGIFLSDFYKAFADIPIVLEASDE